MSGLIEEYKNSIVYIMNENLTSLKACASNPSDIFL